LYQRSRRPTQFALQLPFSCVFREMGSHPRRTTNQQSGAQTYPCSPRAGGLRECLVQVRYVAAAHRPGKRRLWVSRELNPSCSRVQRLSFCFSSTTYVFRPLPSTLAVQFSLLSKCRFAPARRHVDTALNLVAAPPRRDLRAMILLDFRILL
jgi:hypothetical protein